MVYLDLFWFRLPTGVRLGQPVLITGIYARDGSHYGQKEHADAYQKICAHRMRSSASWTMNISARMTETVSGD